MGRHGEEGQGRLVHFGMSILRVNREEVMMAAATDHIVCTNRIAELQDAMNRLHTQLNEVMGKLIDERLRVLELSGAMGKEPVAQEKMRMVAADMGSIILP
jgi:hypothetical protein